MKIDSYYWCSMLKALHLDPMRYHEKNVTPLTYESAYGSHSVLFGLGQYGNGNTAAVLFTPDGDGGYEPFRHFTWNPRRFLPPDTVCLDVQDEYGQELTDFLMSNHLGTMTNEAEEENEVVFPVVRLDLSKVVQHAHTIQYFGN